tara:strand:+ start:431 stop:865 length:435 start_codon:yes stop_codon:yes gene_type:complete
MTTYSFSKWSGSNGIERFIFNQTGCKPFSGAGINPRIKQHTTILKSVDDTYYYDDNMNDINNIKYTLFGHNGDQDENEKKFNEPLLNSNKTQNIYLYRVKKFGKNKEYIWYGKYEIVDKNKKPHIGKDMVMRSIIVLSLKKIDV